MPISIIIVVDTKHAKKQFKKEDIKFLYRGTSIPENYIILSAVLKGKTSIKEEVRKKQQKLILFFS